jgi:metallo-beta-lactamase class B
MFAKASALALLAAACAPVSAPVGPPLASPTALADQCAGKDGWNDPAPPALIYGNSYYVGSCGISAILVTSPAGHVLIDGGTPQAGTLVADNIRKLGFRPKDVRWIVGSHEHFDHAGALAELKRQTGAKFAAPAGAVGLYAAGHSDPSDPQAGVLTAFPPIEVDRPLRDGETIRVGPLRITGHFSPAHGPYGMSWTWTSCESGVCRRMAYVDSISAISDRQYRYTDHPARVVAFRGGMDKIAALPCEVLMVPHPGGANMFARMAGRALLADPNACRAYAETGRANLAKRLADEAADKAP